MPRTRWSREQRAIARAFGRQGAKRRMRVLSAAQRRQIASAAARARYAKATPKERQEAARHAVLARWAKARARGKLAGEGRR
jgi:hypothetical protein